MKTALIMGVSGQDGAYLAQLLLAKGYSVCGTSRDAARTRFDNLQQLGIRDRIRLFSVSLADFGNVLHVLTTVKPDEIYLLTGQSSVELSFAEPIEALKSISVGTLTLLEALRRSGLPARLYNACSGECFGDTGNAAADELTAFRPRSPYAIAKAATFWQVSNYREAYGVQACSGIMFNHESPLRPQRFVTRKIIAAACRIAQGSRERLALGNTAIRRDWGWAPEYVHAMWLMLQQDRLDDYVIATGENHALSELVELAFAHVGLDWREFVVAEQSLHRPSDIGSNRGNPAKALKHLGWSARYRMADVVSMMLQSERRQAGGA